MQRSVPYKNPLDPLLYFILFIGYESLCSIYPILPPLFSLLFVLFIKSMDEKNSVNFMFVVFSLLIYEASMGFLAFLSVIYFSLLYRFIVPKLEHGINQIYMINLSYVVLSYIGFFVFLKLLSTIFLMPSPEMSYYVIYYMIVEFFIVSLI